MNILFLHITQGFSGVEKRFFHYYQYLNDLNDNNYTFLCSKTFLKRHNLSFVPSNNNKILLYGIYWNKSSKYTRYIDYVLLVIKLIRLSINKYDMAHFPTTGSRLFIHFIRAKCKPISVVNSNNSELIREISHPIFYNCLKSGVLVDCLDENIQKVISQKFPKFKKQLYVSPCSFINYEGRCIESGQKEHAICFAGRLIEMKGIDMLVNQMKNILEKTSYNIYILGQGDYREKIIGIKKEFDKHDRIFIDFVLDPINIMEKTEVFLSLQKSENYPSQSLLEAMAAENVIIATNVGLTTKIVKKQFGYLINDGIELLEKLIFLDNNPSVITSMGKCARHFVIANHNVEKYHNYLLSFCSND